MNGHSSEIHIRGRDLRLGRPKSIVLIPQHIAEALDQPIDAIAEFIERTLEELPPEVATDIAERGVYLTGGGAMLHKIDSELERRVGVPFVVPENPMHCVVKGTALVLQTLSEREHLLIKP